MIKLTKLLEIRNIPNQKLNIRNISHDFYKIVNSNPALSNKRGYWSKNIHGMFILSINYTSSTDLDIISKELNKIGIPTIFMDNREQLWIPDKYINEIS